jgi:hypothetical protein
MAVLVGVHGAFHEYWGPHQLRSRWLPAVLDGLAHAGRTVADDDVAFPFYGDIFRPTIDTGRPTDEEVREIARVAGFLDFLEERFGSEGWEAFAEEIGRERLRHLVAQLGRYFTDPALRAVVRERVDATIGPDTRVVVAHSMGTVVAYEVLASRSDHAVDTFVTLGSPLGGEFVRSRLDPPPATVESMVRRWVNVAAIDDDVVREPNLARWFGAVQDVRVDNGPDAHRAEPYLNAAVTGRAMADGLSTGA